MKPLYSGILSAVLVGCAASQDEEGFALERTGANLYVDYFEDTDAVGFHYEVQRVACFSGEAFEPEEITFNVDLSLGVFPEDVEVVELTADTDSRHQGAALFLSLDPGCYDVVAVPFSKIDGDDWTPSYDCTSVDAEGVAVDEMQTTEVLLLSRCVGDTLSSLSTKVASNTPPTIDGTIPPQENEECGPVEVCAAVFDIDDDPLSVAWQVGDDATVTPAPLVLVGYENGYRLWDACAEIVTDVAGAYQPELTVFDLGWDGGVLVKIEDLIAPAESHAEQQFDLQTSILMEDLCFTHEGELVPVDGEALPAKGCEPTTAEEFYCSGHFDADPLVTAEVCWGTFLRTDQLYPVCAGEVPPEHLSPVFSLKDVDVPKVDDKDFIDDPDAAIRLGKALFWDSNLGQDGQACASCHFSAGADSRVKNQVSPGLNDLFVPAAFDSFASGDGGPNYTMYVDDFPLHQLSDIDDRNSTVLNTSGNDVISSMGTFNGDISVAYGLETCETAVDGLFARGGANTRRVEPRNAPTTINAVFNWRNFWDGRANNVFNGVDPLGRRTDTTGVIKKVGGHGLVDVDVRVTNSSLASQAVGPVLSSFEMNCGAAGLGPDFRHAARRLFLYKPLAHQTVHPDDGVLGAHSTGVGLTMTYEDMIEDAFHNKWWDSDELVDGFTLMENNFTLFFGLAVQAYEATLISDDAPFDRFLEGEDRAMTDDQVKGLGLFLGKGHCVNCHIGAELTGAATHLIAEEEEGGLIERMVMGETDGVSSAALYDNAFYNIGVTPTSQDIGVGAVIGGHPVSFTRQEKDRAAGGDPPDHFETNPETFEVDPGVPVDPNERDAVDGAFKTAGLRNISLTGPYFHNGGQATLRQVVEFYNRGGDRRSGSILGYDTECDSTGLNANCSNLDPDITSLELSEEEIDQLVVFLESLTDERVADESDVFSHPSLAVPLGHDGDHIAGSDDGAECDDETLYLPAIGDDGRSAEGLDPVPSFEELLDCVDGDPLGVVACYSDAYEL